MREGEKVRTEVQDYLTKRKRVIEMQKKWNDDVNAVMEEAKKQDEQIKRIEVEEKTF